MSGIASFCEALQVAADINAEQAAKVLHVYREAKVLTVDIHSGHVSVKHGAFLDRDVILRALSAEVAHGAAS